MNVNVWLNEEHGSTNDLVCSLTKITRFCWHLIRSLPVLTLNQTESSLNECLGLCLCPSKTRLFFLTLLFCTSTCVFVSCWLGAHTLSYQTLSYAKQNLSLVTSHYCFPHLSFIPIYRILIFFSSS